MGDPRSHAFRRECDGLQSELLAQFLTPILVILVQRQGVEVLVDLLLGDQLTGNARHKARRRRASGQPVFG
jgi:hypothetical protein